MIRRIVRPPLRWISDALAWGILYGPTFGIATRCIHIQQGLHNRFRWAFPDWPEGI